MESSLSIIIFLQLPSCFISEEDSKIMEKKKARNEKEKKTVMVKGDTLLPA